MKTDLIQQIDGQSRVLSRAVILPTKGPLMDEHHQAVAKALAQFLDDIAMSQTAAARGMGVAPSSLSQYVSGRYAGDKDKLGRKVNRWMEREARNRQVRVELPYIRTRVCQHMRRVVTLAMQLEKMAAIVAPAGAGKTKLMKMLAADAEGVYVYCDKRMTAAKMDVQLAKALKVTTTSNARGQSKWRDACVEKLKGTGRPIFFDEAHLLRPDLFADLRSIYDQTGCSLIFAGAYEILGRVDDRSTGRGQLNRRFLTFNAVEHFAHVEGGGSDGSVSGGEPLFSEDEIGQALEHVDLKLTPSVTQMLWAIACLPSHGCLGIVKDITDIARISFGPGHTVTLDDLELVMQTLFNTRSKTILQSARVHRERFRKTA